MARPRPQAPLAAGQVWAYDFVFDSCANGQQLKCLTVIDEYTRESLAIDVAGSIRSGNTTHDLGGSMTTSEVGDLVARAVAGAGTSTKSAVISS